MSVADFSSVTDYINEISEIVFTAEIPTQRDGFSAKRKGWKKEKADGRGGQGEAKGSWQ